VGDNDGIVFYWVPLLGNVLTLDHRAPVALNAANSQPLGFSDLRSSDIITPTLNPEVHASQYIVGPQQNLIRGFGRETSSFAAKGFTTLGSPDPSSENAWSNPFHIATGTYSGPLTFNTSSVDLVGNVFRLPGDNRPGYPQATIQTVVIPEPAAISLFGFAVVVLLMRPCRSRHQ
jgi:hypothetical protein